MRILSAAILFLWATPVLSAPPDRVCSAGTWGHKFCIRNEHFLFDLCQQLQQSSQRHGLDTGFFTRLIWQESRFDPNAKSHADAMGIAQFIRSTADIRGLADPYNPAEALEKSAQYLAEMERRFGNLGFAAIGYNGGERRATNFKAGTGGLAGETIDYVKIITGLSAATWRDAPPESVDLRLSQTTDFLSACYQLATNRRLSKPPEPEYAIKPWGVQLAFGTTQAQAKAMYNRNTASCRPLLRNERMDLVAVQNRQKQYFMARIGRTSRDNARKLCLALSNSGCRCSVKQNR